MSAKNKIRLDQLLVDRGLAETRSKAQAKVMAGEVSSGEQVLHKSGQLVQADLELELKSRSSYVSRGGDKLASVADKLELDFSAKVVLDVGASTGGFTDFALQHGAAKVYAVDVGTGQLAYRLRQNPKVIVMEQTDIRQAELPELVDIALIDVSFISLARVLDAVAKLIKPQGVIVAMAKPQFEAGKKLADKFGGVIADNEVRQQILAGFEDLIQPEFVIEASADSGLPGAQGNIERFYRLRPKR